MGSYITANGSFPVGYRIVAKILCLLVLVPMVAQAQTAPSMDSLGLEWTESYRYYDQPVDPAIYMIRPGEELTMTFVRAKLGSISLAVGPEGEVVHSTLGKFNFSGYNLEQARAELIEVASDLFNADEITISVSDPRRVAIVVSGAVVNPGTYYGITSQRVSEVIEMAGGVLHTGSTRKIRFSNGSEVLLADLDAAHYLGEIESDPCLYAGNSIHVPDKSADRVQVAGEVNRPREIELLEEDNLERILRLAGGLRSDADRDVVSITSGDSETTLGERQLKPGDVIIVGSQRSNGQHLRISGAVGSPGQYQFSENATTQLLIDRAGGLVAEGNPALTTVFRRAGADEWGRKSRIRYPITGTVGGSGDILTMALRPDDSVYVPYKMGFVTVSGEILSPGRVPYAEGQDASYYIAAAGGFLEGADRERIGIYNRVARTTATRSPGVLLHDGDEIIVRLREELR